MTKASQIISVLFHPLLLTTYLVIILGYLFPPMLMLPKDKLWIFVAMVFCLTFLLPTINLLIFKQLRLVQSLTLANRKDRITPFIFISLIYLVVTGLFVFRIQASANFSKIMIITTTLVVFTCLITFFYKVSVHSLAVWGAIGMVLPLCRPAGQPIVYATICMIAAAGLIMASRLQLNAHTPRQVLVGALTGFSIGFAGIVILF